MSIRYTSGYEMKNNEETNSYYYKKIKKNVIQQDKT